MASQNDDCGAPTPPRKLTDRAVKEIFLFFHRLMPSVFASDPRPRVLRYLVIKQIYHNAVRQFHTDKGTTSRDTIQRVIREGQELRDHISTYGDREKPDDYRTSFIRIDWREGRDKQSFKESFFQSKPPKSTPPPARDPEQNARRQRRPPPPFSSQRAPRPDSEPGENARRQRKPQPGLGRRFGGFAPKGFHAVFTVTRTGQIKCQFVRCKQYFRSKKGYVIHLYVMHRKTPYGCEDIIADYLSSMHPRYTPRHYCGKPSRDS